MSHDVNWDVDKYKEDYESQEQWDLRKAFMERWKEEYPEERLVCLARVFTNIEFMGCRYPLEVMREVSGLSEDIVKSYRQKKKGKLQRTFVSASDAAEDRAKGVKRTGGVISSETPKKTKKIEFVQQGQTVETESEAVCLLNNESDDEKETESANDSSKTNIDNNVVAIEHTDYFKDLQNMECLDVREFKESMFQTSFGRFVLIVRPWTSQLGNIHASCLASRLAPDSTFVDGTFTYSINGHVIAKAPGHSKAHAKSFVEDIAWKKLIDECVILYVKEQWIAQNDTKITTNDVSGKKLRDDQFGTPIEDSVATKMMKLMGWKGGGLGADSQGIAEPIKPKLQIVNRAGLGSDISSVAQLKRLALTLMQRYSASDCLDVDLVFSSDFSKDERAALHMVARRAGLASTSYGKDADRFLVVKKKIDPFSIIREVIGRGGVTPKYQVFIPATLKNRR